MQFLLDTANLDDVRRGALWGIGNGMMAAPGAG
jgi:hypothetical protein